MESGNSPQQNTVEYKEKLCILFDWLEEKQAEDICALDVGGINSVTEGMIFASAANVRHAQALADWILERLSRRGLEFLGMEGYRKGGWILIDCNDVLVNIFQAEERRFYNLEGLWSDAPVVKRSGNEL